MSAWPDLSLEQQLRCQGYQAVAGIDEAGRGPLVGPVVAAAVILPLGWRNPGVRDSKQLSPFRRQALAEAIMADSIHAWGLASSAEIDELNIHRASLLAMARAAVQVSADFLIVDGRFTIPELPWPQRALVKGDSLSCSVAAASILAKIRRDQIMTELHRQYPDYGFDQNKGYPTDQHRCALRELGPCPEHRRSYRPVASLRLL